MSTQEPLPRRGRPRTGMNSDAGPYARSVALNLRRLREASGWTVKEAAKRAGVHYASWYRAEKGESVVAAFRFSEIAKRLFRIQPAEMAVWPPPEKSGSKGKNRR